MMRVPFAPMPEREVGSPAAARPLGTETGEQGRMAEAMEAGA